MILAFIGQTPVSDDEVYEIARKSGEANALKTRTSISYVQWLGYVCMIAFPRQDIINNPRSELRTNILYPSAVCVCGLCLA
jgi:hypothetical protein